MPATETTTTTTTPATTTETSNNAAIDITQNDGDAIQWTADNETAIFYQLGVYAHDKPVNDLTPTEIDNYHRALCATGNQTFLFDVLSGELLREMAGVQMEVAIAGRELANVITGYSRHLIIGTEGATQALDMVMNQSANNGYDAKESDRSLDTRLADEKWYEISLIEANRRFLGAKARSEALVAAKKAANRKPATAAKIPKPSADIGKQGPKINKVCNKDRRPGGCKRFRSGFCRFIHPSAGEQVPGGYKPVHCGGYTPAQNARWAPNNAAFGNSNMPPPLGHPQQRPRQ